MSKVVFVGNIPYEQTEEQLIEIFSEVGPVVSFRLVFERETGKPRGYGFCEFQDERTAASAVRNLNGREIGNRSLKVDFAETDPARQGGRDLDDSSYMMKIGPGADGQRMHGATPLPPPQFQQQQQQQQLQTNSPIPPHQQPSGIVAPPMPGLTPGSATGGGNGGGGARVDPRLANNPGGVPLIPRMPPQQPSVQAGGPPIQPQPAGGPSSADAISAVLGTMTPQNVYDLISSMKVLGANEPERAKAFLNANPQLAYALFQALLMMNLVEPAALQRMFPAMPGGGGKGPGAADTAQAPLPPPSAPQHLPPPPPLPHMGGPIPPHSMQIPFPPPPGGMMQPPPHQAQQPGAAPLQEQQKEIIAKVLALTPQDIASLPEEQRAQILQLRAQLMSTVG
ncbi:hypothetical protein BGZ73_005219 [Actinomortierella ambigua]|nr:hypothetical protein BGZ73_005219 [Actinomortierella ambigua]